jgi:hypothetical protein
MPLAAAVSRPTRPPNADATFDAEVIWHWPLARANAPSLLLDVEVKGREGAAECALSFVVCEGFALPDFGGADQDATAEFSSVAVVPVALLCVELHAANADPQTANISAGTAPRQHTSMSSTPPSRRQRHRHRYKL